MFGPIFNFYVADGDVKAGTAVISEKFEASCSVDFTNPFAGGTDKAKVIKRKQYILAMHI
jgi:hypothetical protein